MLVFFHMHKCAGTTVVEAAKASGMRLPPNANGNPTEGGKIIRWSQLTDAECENRVRGFANEFDFIAFERDLPPWHILDKIDGLKWFTVLREPQSRAYSNFNYSGKRSPQNKHFEFGFQSVAANSQSYIRNNYYTSMLCQIPASAHVTSEHLDFAIKRLERFEGVGIFEKTPIGEQLLHLGFTSDAFGHHKKRQDRSDGFKYPVSQAFFERNTFDCALYSYFLAKSGFGS